ncbi:hypothetical protein C6Y14_27280 [Streptomyces dioscori]|uniref:Uncharacterized protein n=1 Tax=Streptomyces dioscori TaxID=2109333 RepID=A0A2P8Q2B1_9ACTN|nr:hypothetical protein C6Y14_27280 [Streptomyces dioscori]
MCQGAANDNDGIGMNYCEVPTGCRATTKGGITWEGPGWYKISSAETVTLNGYSCSGGGA